MIACTWSQATKEKEAYEKAMKKYIPSDQYQAALDQLARAKAKLNGGDKKSKDTEKKKSVAAKAKVQANSAYVNSPDSGIQPGLH